MRSASTWRASRPLPPDLLGGPCPRNDESAGKRRSTRVRKGAPWLKTTLVQAAWAAVREKNAYFRAQFLRIKPAEAR